LATPRALGRRGPRAPRRHLVGHLRPLHPLEHVPAKDVRGIREVSKTPEELRLPAPDGVTSEGRFKADAVLLRIKPEESPSYNGVRLATYAEGT
jgi:hypothetical protein